MPFIRTSFRELTKVFDLSEFELDRTDEDLFKTDKRMKNSQQLRTEIDSINRSLKKNHVGVLDQIAEAVYRPQRTDSLGKPDLAYVHYYTPGQRVLLDSLSKRWQNADSALYKALSAKVIAELQINQDKRESLVRDTKNTRIQKAKFEYELYIKYSFAAVCFLFIFIGAPLGAIVRKGGYGYPLIICILVFVSYILLNTFCKRLTEGLRIPTLWAAWLPCMILLIPGILLTWSAMRDRNALDDLKLLFKKLLRTNKG